MKKIIVAALASSLVSGAAIAGGFDGPFVQLGIGGSGTSTKVSGTDSQFDGSSSQGSVNGLVSAGWSQSIGAEGFNLAANLFYVIGNQNAGSKSFSGNGTWQNGSNSGTYENSASGSNTLKNTFGISVEPGWNFTESTLGFVKLAWLNSRINSSFNDSGSCTTNGGGNCNYDPSNSSFNKTINGFGYGLGVKQLVTQNIFVGVDLMGVTYGSANIMDGVSVKPSQFMGFASVGYKF